MIIRIFEVLVFGAVAAVVLVLIWARVYYSAWGVVEEDFDELTGFAQPEPNGNAHDRRLARRRAGKLGNG